MYVGASSGRSSSIEVAFGYSFLSVAYASTAVATERRSAIVRFCRERCCAVTRFGMAMAARMPRTAMRKNPPMITITTIIAVFDPPLPAAAGALAPRGAPLDGFPHLGQGAYETSASWLPQ